MNSFYFNKSNVQNIEILKSFGFTTEQLSDGILDESEVENSNIEAIALRLVSASEAGSVAELSDLINHNSFQLSDSEMQTLKKLVQESQSQPLLAKFLFSGDDIDGMAPLPFLYNHLKNHYGYFTQFSGSVQPSSVSLNMLTANVFLDPEIVPTLSGAYFQSAQIPKNWQSLLESYQLNFVFMTGNRIQGGSGVCISSDGMVRTAAHIFSDHIQQVNGIWTLTQNFYAAHSGDIYELKPQDIEIVKYNPTTDEMIVKINPKKFPNLKPVPSQSSKIPHQGILVSVGSLITQSENDIHIGYGYSFSTYDQRVSAPRPPMNLEPLDDLITKTGASKADFNLSFGDLKKGFSGGGTYLYNPDDQSFTLVGINSFRGVYQKRNVISTYPVNP